METVFAPISNIIFDELDCKLNPLFSSSARYVNLSSQKDSISRDGYSVNIDKPFEKTVDLPELKAAISEAKSMWLTYSVAMAKGTNPPLQRFMICYHMELSSDSYRFMGINKDFKYGSYPNPAEVYKILNVIMDKVTYILEHKIDAITYI